MRKTALVMLGVIALLVSACGSDATDTITDASPTEDGDAVTVDEPNPTEDDTTTPESTVVDDEVAVAEEAAQDAGSATAPVTNGTATLRSSVLARTVDGSETAITSARFEGKIDMVGTADSELPGPVSLSFAGAYDLPNDASEVSVDFSGMLAAIEAGDESGEAAIFSSFFEDPLEMITIGETSWTKWGLISAFTGTDGQWLEAPADESDDLTSEFGFGATGSPTELLDILAEANAELEELGTEDLRGVSTTHIRALVDGEGLAATMSADERAAFEEQLGTTPEAKFPMDFWIDGDGLLHRYMIDLSDPELLAASGDGDEIESLTMTFDMWDHGTDLGITPPPADQVVTEEDIELNFSGEFEG